MTDKNDFLPEDYTPDEGKGGDNQYMKFQDGANRFRILEKPIIGYLFWKDEDGNVVEKGSDPRKGNKPVRVPKLQSHKLHRALEIQEFENSKEFWAMPVWNYQATKDEDGNAVGAVQILEITQTSIIKPLWAFVKDPDWGSPAGYDIVVNRKGEGKETEYQTNPKPHKPLAEEITKAFEEVSVETELLFENEDPFGNNKDDEKLADEISKGMDDEESKIPF